MEEVSRENVFGRLFRQLEQREESYKLQFSPIKRLSRSNLLEIILNIEYITDLTGGSYRRIDEQECKKLCKDFYKAIVKSDVEILKDGILTREVYERALKACYVICQKLEIDESKVFPGLIENVLAHKKSECSMYGVWQEIRFPFSRTSSEGGFPSGLVKRSLFEIEGTNQKGIVHACGRHTSYAGTYKVKGGHTYIFAEKTQGSETDPVNQIYNSIVQSDQTIDGDTIRLGICLGSGMQFHHRNNHPIVASRSVFIRNNEMTQLKALNPMSWEYFFRSDVIKRKFCSYYNPDESRYIDDQDGCDENFVNKNQHYNLLFDDEFYDHDVDGGNVMLLGRQMIVRNKV